MSSLLPLDAQGFRRHVDELDLGVRALSTLVAAGIPQATEAFLGGDGRSAAMLLAEHEAGKGIADRLEARVSIEIARHSPMGSDLRFLVSVLRVAPALGRCLELIDHVAARHWVRPMLPDDAAAAMEELGRLTTGMWQVAGEAWCENDATAVSRLNEVGDSVDALVSELPRRLRQPGVTPVVAMQVAMVGRFYERLGAHAVDFAKRTRWCVTGE